MWRARQRELNRRQQLACSGVVVRISSDVRPIGRYCKLVYRLGAPDVRKRSGDMATKR